MDTFYPFVENSSNDDNHHEGENELPEPSYPARIAVYDDPTMPPRVVVIEPKDIRTYLQEIQDTVYQLMMQQGGSFGYSTVRELVENYIHAYFIEPTISILDKGQTLIFSDQGPGIPNKQAAIKPSFTSATREMKKYIRGVGSGFPTVEQNIHARGGTITIEDNIGHGTVVTISLAHAHANDTEGAGYVGRGAGMPSQAGSPQAQPTPTMPGQQQVSAASPAASGYVGMPTPGAAGAMPITASPQQPYAAPPQYGQQPMYYPYYGYPYGYQPQQVSPGQQQYVPGQYAPCPVPQYAQGFPAAQGAQQAFAARPQRQYGDFPPSPVAQPDHAATRAPQGMPEPQGTGDAMPSAGAADAPRVISESLRQVLLLFKRQRQVGTTDVNESLGVSLSTGTRRLQELNKIGLIYKPNNNKKYCLTDEGKKFITNI